MTAIYFQHYLISTEETCPQFTVCTCPMQHRRVLIIVENYSPSFSQNGKFGQNGKLGHSCTNVTKGKLYGSQDSDHAIVHLGLNVSSSAHNCGCVVDGGSAMAAI